MTRRITCEASGGPTPAAFDNTRRRCASPRSSGATAGSARGPGPLVTPKMRRSRRSRPPAPPAPRAPRPAARPRRAEPRAAAAPAKSRRRDGSPSGSGACPATGRRRAERHQCCPERRMVKLRRPVAHARTVSDMRGDPQLGGAPGVTPPAQLLGKGHPMPREGGHRRISALRAVLGFHFYGQGGGGTFAIRPARRIAIMGLLRARGRRHAAGGETRARGSMTT